MSKQKAAVRSACDVFSCETCDHWLRDRCPGCAEGNRVRAADGNEQCGIYVCVTSKGFASCDECSAVACRFPRALAMVCPVRASFEKKRCYASKLSKHFLERHHGGDAASEIDQIPDKMMSRLRRYLFALSDFLSQGITRVSSQDISCRVGVNASAIRRDLTRFGEFGRPSIGYDAAFLRSRLAEILHLEDSKNVVWVGAARLAGDQSQRTDRLVRRLEQHGFKIVAVLDTDHGEDRERIGGLEVRPLSAAGAIIDEFKVDAAVIAAAEDQAQNVADVLVAAGVRAILNLSSAVITVPGEVMVRNVDIVAELFALSYYCGEVSKHAVGTRSK